MNWVGGIRSRIKSQQERKIQKEFFERRKFLSKMHRHQRQLTSSPEGKCKGVSQDLLALQLVNKSSDKIVMENDNLAPRKVKKVDLGQRPDPFRREDRDLELPMSPDLSETPSVIQLNDLSSSFHSVDQKPDKWHHWRDGHTTFKPAGQVFQQKPYSIESTSSLADRVTHVEHNKPFIRYLDKGSHFELTSGPEEDDSIYKYHKGNREEFNSTPAKYNFAEFEPETPYLSMLMTPSSQQTAPKAYTSDTNQIHRSSSTSKNLKYPYDSSKPRANNSLSRPGISAEELFITPVQKHHKVDRFHPAELQSLTSKNHHVDFHNLYSSQSITQNDATNRHHTKQPERGMEARPRDGRLSGYTHYSPRKEKPHEVLVADGNAYGTKDRQDIRLKHDRKIYNLEQYSSDTAHNRTNWSKYKPAGLCDRNLRDFPSGYPLDTADDHITAVSNTTPRNRYHRPSSILEHGLKATTDVATSASNNKKKDTLLWEYEESHHKQEVPKSDGNILNCLLDDAAFNKLNPRPLNKSQDKTPTSGHSSEGFSPQVHAHSITGQEMGTPKQRHGTSFVIPRHNQDTCTPSHSRGLQSSESSEKREMQKPSCKNAVACEEMNNKVNSSKNPSIWKTPCQFAESPSSSGTNLKMQSSLPTVSSDTCKANMLQMQGFIPHGLGTKPSQSDKIASACDTTERKQMTDSPVRAVSEKTNSLMSQEIVQRAVTCSLISGTELGIFDVNTSAVIPSNKEMVPEEKIKECNPQYNKNAVPKKEDLTDIANNKKQVNMQKKHEDDSLKNTVAQPPESREPRDKKMDLIETSLDSQQNCAIFTEEHEENKSGGNMSLRNSTVKENVNSLTSDSSDITSKCTSGIAKKGGESDPCRGDTVTAGIPCVMSVLGNASKFETLSLVDTHENEIMCDNAVSDKDCLAGNHGKINKTVSWDVLNDILKIIERDAFLGAFGSSEDKPKNVSTENTIKPSNTNKTYNVVENTDAIAHSTMNELLDLVCYEQRKEAQHQKPEGKECNNYKKPPLTSFQPVPNHTSDVVSLCSLRHSTLPIPTLSEMCTKAMTKFSPVPTSTDREVTPTGKMASKNLPLPQELTSTRQHMIPHKQKGCIHQQVQVDPYKLGVLCQTATQCDIPSPSSALLNGKPMGPVHAVVSKSVQTEIHAVDINGFESRNKVSSSSSQREGGCRYCGCTCSVNSPGNVNGQATVSPTAVENIGPLSGGDDSLSNTQESCHFPPEKACQEHEESTSSSQESEHGFISQDNKNTFPVCTNKTQEPRKAVLEKQNDTPVNLPTETPSADSGELQVSLSKDSSKIIPQEQSKYTTQVPTIETVAKKSVQESSPDKVSSQEFKGESTNNQDSFPVPDKMSSQSSSKDRNEVSSHTNNFIVSFSQETGLPFSQDQSGDLSQVSTACTDTGSMIKIAAEAPQVSANTGQNMEAQMTRGAKKRKTCIKMESSSLKRKSNGEHAMPEQKQYHLRAAKIRRVVMKNSK
ncbi:uncharacterized protein LOC106164584 [Lingula anatina]|uniref:Uncharacterized protein LOC106164584 n=1 Tax=Lingula anatina TaxID=7574 RepID=A0A1S3IIE0_LINAN|nr:uncharacterized protein LOC106164584 [Lingula anatina]|eukprot:XP_013398005.1 uncharacterized protein LOC106164584 [Lingula anatina]